MTFEKYKNEAKLISKVIKGSKIPIKAKIELKKAETAFKHNDAGKAFKYINKADNHIDECCMLDILEGASNRKKIIDLSDYEAFKKKYGSKAYNVFCH